MTCLDLCSLVQWLLSKTHHSWILNMLNLYFVLMLRCKQVLSSTPIISFLPFGPYRSDCQSSDDVQSSQAVESLGIISGLTLSICEGEEKEVYGIGAIEENCEARPRAALQHLVQREASELAALGVPLEMNLPDVSLKV